MRVDLTNSWWQATSLALIIRQPILLRTTTKETNKILEETSTTTGPTKSEVAIEGQEAEVETTMAKATTIVIKEIPKLSCQVYGKNGHDVAVCYHKFDKEYVPSHTNNQGRNYGHHQNQPSNQGSGAYVIEPETIGDAAWYLDSGATNHITNDIKQPHPEVRISR